MADLPSNEDDSSRDRDFPRDSRGNYPGFRCRPWPCSECDEELTEVDFLVRCGETGECPHGDDPEKIAATQKRLLLAWVEKCPHSKWTNFSPTRIAEGSEHIVFFSEYDSQVYKVTRPGTFGESYYLHNGLVYQRECSPLDYLLRLRLWNEVFQMAPRSLGVTDSGQIFSVQPFIAGIKPTQDSVNVFLAEADLIAVKKACWLWKKSYADYEIWVGDARDDNFVETPDGIVPIDLRLWSTERT